MAPLPAYPAMPDESSLVPWLPNSTNSSAMIYPFLVRKDRPGETARSDEAGGDHEKLPFPGAGRPGGRPGDGRGPWVLHVERADVERLRGGHVVLIQGEDWDGCGLREAAGIIEFNEPGDAGDGLGPALGHVLDVSGPLRHPLPGIFDGPPLGHRPRVRSQPTLREGPGVLLSQARTALEAAVQAFEALLVLGEAAAPERAGLGLHVEVPVPAPGRVRRVSGDGDASGSQRRPSGVHRGPGGPGEMGPRRPH